MTAAIYKGWKWTFVIMLPKSPREWTVTAHLSSNHNLNAFMYYFSIKGHYFGAEYIVFFLFEKLVAISLIANIWKNAKLERLCFYYFCLSKRETHTYRHWCPPPDYWGQWQAERQVMDGQGLITFNQLCPWIMMNHSFYTHRMQADEGKIERGPLSCILCWIHK